MTEREAMAKALADEDDGPLLIKGTVVASTVRTMSSLGSIGLGVLARYGIDQIDLDGWYPYSAREEIHNIALKRYGTEALFSFGFTQGDIFLPIMTDISDAYRVYRKAFDAADGNAEKEADALAGFVNGYAQGYGRAVKTVAKQHPDLYGAHAEVLGPHRFIIGVKTFSDPRHEAFTRGVLNSQFNEFLAQDWQITIINVPERTEQGQDWVCFRYQLDFVRTPDQPRSAAEIAADHRLAAREALLKNVVEQSNRSLSVILESIQYASLLQQGQLPDPRLLRGPFASLDVIWQPRDVIGGDIWWASLQADGSFVLALADCTGHGVPGAMLSVLVISTLERIFANDPGADPSTALMALDDTMRRSLRQLEEDKGNDDGCDAAIVRIDPSQQTLSYAGAKVDLFSVSGAAPVQHCRAARVSLGYRQPPAQAPELHRFRYTKGDQLVMVTDGLTDQIGSDGGARRAFGNKRLQATLETLRGGPATAITHGLLGALQRWQGHEERRDDLTIVSIVL